MTHILQCLSLKGFWQSKIWLYTSNLLQQDTIHTFGHPIPLRCFSNYEVPPYALITHSYKNRSLVYLPPLSEQSTLIFFPMCFSIRFFHPTNKSRTSPLCVYPATPRVMYTSKWWRLNRSPNIRVNVINNPLCAVNSGVKIYLDLLAND